MRKMPVRRQGVLFKMVWIVFLCCMAWTWQATAEFGVSLHSEYGYSLHAFTFSYQEGYAFRPRVIVQYDPCFSGENRICAFDLYVNGEVCARLEKWSNQAVPGYAEHRAEFRLDRHQSSEYVRELALVPIWTEGTDTPQERILLQPEWSNSFGEISAYVQSEEANAAPLYDAPGSDHILLTLFNGVKLTAIGPPMQDGWVAVYLKTAQDELYGYMEGEDLRFGDDAVYSVISQTQPVRISDGASLFTLHPPRSEVVTFNEPSYAVALGYGKDSVLVATESGLGLVDEACCTHGNKRPGRWSFLCSMNVGTCCTWRFSQAISLCPICSAFSLTTPSTIRSTMISSGLRCGSTGNGQRQPFAFLPVPFIAENSSCHKRRTLFCLRLNGTKSKSTMEMSSRFLILSRKQKDETEPGG